MKKLYKIVMGLLYTIIGSLVLLCVVVLFFDKLEFLHPSTEFNELFDSGNTYDKMTFTGDEDYNTLTFPISAVKAMELVDRFANPWTRPLMVELQTGDIFCYYEEEGLKTLEEVIPLMVDHREYTDDERYEEGYEFFHYYMRFLIDKCDRKTTSELTDTSYFEKRATGEKKEYYK